MKSRAGQGRMGGPAGTTRAGAALSRRRALRAAGLAAGALLPGAAVVACAGQGPGEGGKAAPKADLRMMFFHAQWKEAFDEVIRNFQQRNPTITVEFGTAPPGGPGHMQALAAMLAADAGPDMFSINWDGVRTLTARNNLLDLTPEVNRDRAFSRDLAAYHPKIQALMKVDGKQRGVGLDHDDIALYWNVSLFNQMQVRPLTEVHDKWTWNEVLDLARRLTKKPEQQYGFFGHNVGGQTGYWSFVFANGGNVVTDDGSSFAPLLDNAAVEAIQWLTEAGVRHGVSPQPDEIQAATGTTNVVTLFQQGKLAMLVDGSWRLNAHVTANLGFEWDVAHLPHAPRTASALRSCTEPGSELTRPAGPSTRRPCSSSTSPPARRTKCTDRRVSSSRRGWTSGTPSTPVRSLPRTGRC